MQEPLRHRLVDMSQTKQNPIVFIHGLWIHASSWQPWQEFFGDAGYGTQAPGWPGDQDTVELTRGDPDSVTDKGIDDVADHFAAIIDGLPTDRSIAAPSWARVLTPSLGKMR
jgi:hypothetical protein